MASYAENTCFLKLDSVEIQTFFKKVTPKATCNGIDITRGAGQDWVQRAPGLMDISFEIELSHDTSVSSTYIQKLAPGAVVTLEWGIEGAVSGKPRHVQSVLITNNDYSVEVGKADVTYTITADGADTPSVNYYTGGAYS